ncbi:MAG: autotransporter-associated beta strand repeat-containing protein [Candidatus Falkowbacteria bacterium]|nr:autotransporter-associated beta strand repeat-containing protein [Candidatus Falkowbacteria bacterium]
MPAKLPRKTYKRKSTKPELIPVKFSRSLFISKKVRFVVGGLVLLALIIYPFTRVKKIEAEVTPFFSGSCDGGWENSDKAVGAPNIIEGGIDKYSDLNSASISNSIAQIRCGGFRGEVPQDVVPKKVILKFSWTNHLENVIDISPSIDQGPASVNEVPAQGSNVESNQNEQPANQAPLEVSPSGESSFLKNFFFTSTHAQENDPSQVLPVTSSDVVDPAAVSAEEPVSSDRPIIPEGSVVEVRYTLDGTKWDTLGYASDINNSVSFEIPTGVLSGFADLEKIQVALQTLPTIDNAPKIYLDAMWLNVEYQPSSQELSQGEIDNLPRVRIDNVFKPTEEDFRADEKPKFEVDNTVLDAKTTEIINEQKAASEPAPGPIPEPAPETLPKADTKTDPGTQPEVTPPAADPLQEPSSNATQLRKLISILGGDWLKKTVLTAFAQDAIDPAPVAPVEAPVEIPATLPVDAPTDTPAPAATDTVTPIPTDTAAPTPTDIVAPIPTDTVAPTSTEAPALAPITKANFKVIKSDVFDPEGEKAELQPVIEEINGAISISLPTPSDNFLPGKYKMDVEILRGRLVFVSSQDFTWGVLAINTNKSTYLPKEDAYLQMGTLSDTGNTICDANLKLKITNVNLQTETELSTSAGTIEYSKTCGVNNITDNPDYFAHYQVGDPGVYDMTLQKIDPNNGSVIYEIKDSFEVKDSLPFEVERIGATRINPFLSKYVMNFKVKANQDFNGVIVETVPVSMKVTETDDTKQKEENGKKYIIWEKSLSAGQTIDLSYEYQGAKISPQVYLLGPLNFSNPVNWLQRLFGADDKLIFKEAGQWQVASDSLTATWTGAVNGNWSNGGNWSGGVVPGAGDNLVFPNGASNLSNTNDLIQNTIFNSITFLGSGYTLAGNDIILGQGVAGITDGVASGGNTISLNIRLDATRNIFITNSAETLTISGMIGGAGGFNKEGTGKLILSGANTFAGATTINAGIVNLRHAEALGAIAAGTAVVGGAELQLQDGINIGYEALTLRGFGVLGGGALRNISGDNSFAGLITLVAGGAEIDSDSGTLSLTGGVTGTFNLNIDGAGNITFDMSPLAIAGATLTKNGAGTLKYNFPNTYTGTTVINSGTLLYGVDNAILSGAITVNNGTLDIATYSDMVGTITLGLIGDLSNPTITGSTGVLSSATFTVYSGTISAIIAGDGGALTKSTPGTVILTRPNLYSGAVSVSAGILDIRDSMALGVIDGITTVSAGATLLINGSGLSIPEYITISGTGMLYTGAIHNATGNNTLTGVVTLAAAAVIDSDSSTTLTIDQKGISAVSFALTVSGAGNVTTTTSAPIWATSASLVKNDAGTLTLGGYNNFTGSTVINDGIVILSGAGTLPSSAVTINSGATLTVDNSATDLLNRISSSAFTMNGGNFNYIGNSLSDASESAGALTLTSGHNIITVTPGAGGPTTMTFASLARTAGATALFRGTNLGSTPAANVSTLMFTTIGANLIGAAGAANSKTISVIKGGFGDTSLSGTGSDMVTYNVGNTNGLRLLNQAGFSGEYASDFSTINTNVKLTAGTAATTQSVNSLILNGFDVTNPGTGQTLTMASASLSGNILINSANNIAGANTTLGITTNELDILASASSTVSAVIGTAVAGSLTLSGTGNVTLSTASLYTGLTSVNNVTLTYGASNVISSGGVTVNNGTLDMGANSDTVGAVIMQRGTITGGAGVLTGSSFELRSGTVSAIIAGSGTTTRIATNTAADSIVLLTRDNTYSGVTAIDNTYSGVTAITSGILKLGAAGGATNTPLGTAVGGTTIATIGALDLNGFSMTSGEPITSLNGLGYGSGATVANGNSNMGALMNSSSTTVSYSGAITLGAAARIAADASVMNISSNISGAFVLTIGGFNDSTFSGTLSTITGVTKDGFGTLTLSGNNSYAGVTTVSVGDLKLGAAGGATNTPLGIAGAGNNTLVSAGAMLDLNGFTLGTAELLTINGTGFGLGDFALGALTNTSASAVTYSGLLTLGSASTIIANNGDINLSAAGTITGAGLGLTIGGSGNGTLTSVLGTTSGTLTKIGTGIWTLSGASTFTGAATIANGTIKLGVAGDTLNTPLGVIAGATTVNSGGVLDLNGFTIGTAEPKRSRN